MWFLQGCTRIKSQKHVVEYGCYEPCHMCLKNYKFKEKHLEQTHQL